MDPKCDKIQKSRRFAQHSRYLIQMLDRSLSLLGPDVETLSTILHELGRKHVHYGVKEDFFPPMGTALIQVLKELLNINDEVEASWVEVYTALSGQMIKAMNEERTVLRTWHKVKRIPNYQEEVGVVLFQKLFEDCPDTKALFGFALNVDVNSAAVLESKRFRTHAAYFVDMLDKALAMIEAQEVEENMDRLGKMHAGYGVTKPMFGFMGQALMFALKKVIKKGWTDATQEAWEIVYERLSEQMIEAMEKEGSFTDDEDDES